MGALEGAFGASWGLLGSSWVLPGGSGVLRFFWTHTTRAKTSPVRILPGNPPGPPKSTQRGSKRTQACSKETQADLCLLRSFKRNWFQRRAALSVNSYYRSSVVLGALGGEMLQNVAVAKEWLVFLQKCCCGLRSGGVPLQNVSHSNIVSAFTHILNAFDGLGGHPGLRQQGSVRVTCNFGPILIN